MCTKTDRSHSELSESAEEAHKLCKKAVKSAPRVKKKITVRSLYFGKSNHPCAESLLSLELDCNLLKLMIWLLVGMFTVALVCSFKRKKRN